MDYFLFNFSGVQFHYTMSRTYKITVFSQNLCYNLSKQGLRFRLLQS